MPAIEYRFFAGCSLNNVVHFDLNYEARQRDFLQFKGSGGCGTTLDASGSFDFTI